MTDDPLQTRTLVRDLMTVGVLTVAPDTALNEVARLLLAKDLEGVVVLDADGSGHGIITHDELLAAYSHPRRETLTAEDIMREGVPELPPDIPLTAAAAMMRDMGVRVVFLNHNANGVIYPAAMLSYKHFLRHLAARSDDDLRDLGTDAQREAPHETFIRRRDEAKRQVDK
jgi:CBS domain-containing protein